MLTYVAVEKTSYRIKRVKAYGFYFWYIRDMRKGVFLCGSQWCTTLYVYRWPSTRFNKNWKKEDILDWVPGFYPTKKLARTALNKYLKIYGVER